MGIMGGLNSGSGMERFGSLHKQLKFNLVFEYFNVSKLLSCLLRSSLLTSPIYFQKYPLYSLGRSTQVPFELKRYFFDRYFGVRYLAVSRPYPE